MEAEVANGNAGAKLAFTRLTFNYFISEAAFAYIVDAVHLLARDGFKLLPLYHFDPATASGNTATRHRRRRQIFAATSTETVGASPARPRVCWPGSSAPRARSWTHSRSTRHAAHSTTP